MTLLNQIPQPNYPDRDSFKPRVMDIYTDGTYTVLEYLQYGTLNFIVTKTLTGRIIRFANKEYDVKFIGNNLSSCD